MKVSVVCFYETEVNSKTVRPFTAQVSTPGDTPCVRKRLSPWNEPLPSPPLWPPCPRATVPLGGLAKVTVAAPSRPSGPVSLVA